jgi:uncharacterized membrane protein YtjA (UPF0391 family)
MSLKHFRAGITFALSARGGGPVETGADFLVVGLVAALLGFTGIAGASFAVAKLFAAIFAILFLLFLILGLTATRRIA